MFCQLILIRALSCGLLVKVSFCVEPTMLLDVEVYREQLVLNVCS